MTLTTTVLLAETPEWLEKLQDPAAWPDLIRQFESYFNVAGIICVSLGGLLLLFGVKLARLLVALCFAAGGAWVGVLIALMNHDSAVGRMPWLAGLGGALLAGLLAFLMFRAWLTFLLAFMLALTSAGVGAWIVAGDELADLGDRAIVLAKEVKAEHDRLPGGARQIDPLGEKARKERWEREVKDIGEELGQIGKAHGLKVGLTALGGFVLGLILGAFAYKLILILLTALIGVGQLVLGGYVLAVLHKPGLIDRARDYGWKLALPIVGAFLMGVAIQGFLAHKRTRPEESAGQEIELDI